VSAELIGQLFDDFNRGDFEAALAKVHEDVDWAAPPDMPDVSEDWRSRDEMQAGITRFMLAWEHLQVDLAEVVRDGGERVVVDTRWHGRSRGTGIDVDQRIAQVYDLEDGKVRRVRQFRTREQALEATGD
jgi:ketosteroid isomerase-like protein